MNNLETMRHSASHILAMAVLKLYPKAKLTIGPAIEDGFYYDFELPKPISDEDLPKIEKEMGKIVTKKIPFKQVFLKRNEAKKLYRNNPFKQELLDEIVNSASSPQAGDKMSFYETNDFRDLCRGPHVSDTGKIGVFKLTHIAGAYWRGDEKKPMLTRIYGVAFGTKKELDAHLQMLEEAKKRDHRKLGKELDLFCFSDLVGPGLPLYTPRGVVIIEELKNHIERVCADYGFEKVMTPHLAKMRLYELSGHADKFGEELFHVSSPRGHEFVMKPVQCPHQTQIYASRPRSYRDLPIRYMESERQYRAEKPGEIGGLNRVYAITVEDGHSFCRVDQVKEEVRGMVNIIKKFYNALGLWGNHWVSLSLRDREHPEKYIGEPKDWDVCERMLQEVSEEMKLGAKRREGEAALYGPKLDFMFKDAFGREIQIPTVQVDFATPKRFELVYTDKDGREKPPVMVHRAVLGSYERFLALLIEYFAGEFPVWLAPVQAIVIPISEKQNKYADKVAAQLKEVQNATGSLRIEVDGNDSTLQKKIRNAQLQKIPYMLIVGEKEQKNKTISVRLRDGRDLGPKKIEQFVKRAQVKIKGKKLSL